MERDWRRFHNGIFLGPSGCQGGLDMPRRKPGVKRDSFIAPIISGGRVTIDADLRRQLGIKEGDYVRMSLVPGTKEIRVVKVEQ